MSELTDSAERAYRAWLRTTHMPAHARRTAGVAAAFLLPHLTPGQRLLDAGCGPGSITLGLAEALSPGEVVGIDASPVAIDAASALAATRGTTNVQFEVADLYALPFADATFDVVYMNCVLQHVPDAVDALRSVRRVLRPGGLMAVADADFGGSILWPETAAMRRALRLMSRVRAAQGGDIHAGRKLGAWLFAAGFVDVMPGTNAATIAGAASVLTGDHWARYYAAPELHRHVEAINLATSAACTAASAAWRAWGATPGAYWATFSCHALARKPR